MTKCNQKYFFKVFFLLIVLDQSSKHLVLGSDSATVATTTTTNLRPIIPGYRLNNEKRLIDDLFKNYQVKFGRPVNNMTEKVVVYFGITLIQLIDLDERNQVLITNVHTNFQWKDNGLRWNKTQYGGIDDIRLPVEKLWTPDITLYNYADTRLEEKRDALAIVSAEGVVKWRPPGIFKSTCQINIEKFPYDEQNCSMKFGSWTYDGFSIDIQFYEGSKEVNIKEYTESNEWEILSTMGIRTEKKYECCKEVYPDITFYIKMKRKGGFYNYILVLPCVLLSCLTTVLFWLPPETPSKMVLGMSIFTSFFVLLLLLSKNVPSATDKIPLIGAYYCLNMVMIATSTCSCTVVVHIFFRGEGQVPFMIRKIFLEFLARIFCMVTPPALPAAQLNKLNEKKPAQPAALVTSLNNQSNLTNGLIHRVNHTALPSNNSRVLSQHSNSFSGLNNNNEETHELLNSSLQCHQFNNELLATQTTQPKLDSSFNSQHMPSNLHFTVNNTSIFQTLPSQARSTAYHQHPQQANYQPQHSFQQKNQLSNDLYLSFNLIENDIKEIRDYLRHTRKKLENKDAKTKQTNEWKQVALVLDRTLFFLYIIAIIVSVTIMFPR